MNKLKKENKMLLQELLDTVTAEAKLYEGLASTASHKQEAIMQNNIEDLAKYSGVENRLMRKGNMLTSKRLELTAANLPGKERKIQSLSTFMNSNKLTDNDELNQASTRINAALKKIKQLNNENSVLLKTSINYVQGLIKMYYPKSKPESKLYTKEGKAETAKQSVVDCGV